jgi:alpha-tubulin suppressor-like RCC1 family protein
LLTNGKVKCWGRNYHGEMGIGDTADRGSAAGQMGDSLAYVDLGTGRTAVSLSAGLGFTCALLDNAGVKCWGDNLNGQLGLGDTNHRGDGPGEMGDALPFVDLGAGRTATSISTGYTFTCAILDNGHVKCWGAGTLGQLGLGDKLNRGDGPGEMGNALPYVELGTGRTATSISAGEGHACAILDNGNLKCWGSSLYGQLGLGDKNTKGDGPAEMGDGLPYVDVGTGRTATAVSAGDGHTCALLDNSSLKCWGRNFSGQLGFGDTVNRGDGPGEMGNALPSVDLGTGRTATLVSAGDSQTCAHLDNSQVKCWGNNNVGQLGLGDKDLRGDGPGEMGDALPYVSIGTGRTAASLSTGDSHSCTPLDNGRLKCWGYNYYGRLGLGDQNNRGDGPGEMGDALPYLDLGTK